MKFQYWDVAFSKSDFADFSACVTAGVDQNQNIYILSAVYKRMTPGELKEEIIRQYDVWKPQLVGIEDTAFKYRITKEIIQDVTSHSMIPLISDRPIGDKVTRALLPASRAEAGKLFVNKKAHWWPELQIQLLTLGTPRQTRDDLADSTSGCVNLISKQHGATQLPKSQIYGSKSKPVLTFDPFHRLEKDRLIKRDRLQARLKKKL